MPSALHKARLAVVPKKQKELTHQLRRSKATSIVATASVVLVASWLFLALFGPTLPYKISVRGAQSLTDPEFMRQLEAQTLSKATQSNSIQLVANAENFYPAELAAIAAAQHSIDWEAYIFRSGEVARKMVRALAQRARAGVKVKIVIDALGSASTTKNFFKELTDAGGKVEWYHPIRVRNWIRANNRTHRELLVIDGRMAFVGGAGVADHWAMTTNDQPRWRDDMFRVEGDSVATLQGTFGESWLAASGEVLDGPEYFPPNMARGRTPALVVASSPTSGDSTRARLLFQVLLASAKQSIQIVTPYFVPDDSLKQELVRAMRERGVRLSIMVPGDKSDHKWTRALSRSRYGDLLQAGARIFEYQPAMIHQKSLVVDGSWVVVGSTNFDNRSFGINDEVNLAALDPVLAQSLTQQFEQDIPQSRQITYDGWKKRGPLDRVRAELGWLFERQE